MKNIKQVSNEDYNYYKSDILVSLQVPITRERHLQSEGGKGT